MDIFDKNNDFNVLLLNQITAKHTAFPTFMEFALEDYTPTLIGDSNQIQILSDCYDSAQATFLSTDKRVYRGLDTKHAQAPEFSPNKIITNDDPPQVLSVDEVYFDDYKVESIPDPAPVYYGVCKLVDSQNTNAMFDVWPDNIEPHVLLEAFEASQNHFKTIGRICGPQYGKIIIKLLGAEVAPKTLAVVLGVDEQAEQFIPPPPLPETVDLSILKRAEKYVEHQVKALVEFLQDYEGLDPDRKDERVREAYHMLSEQGKAAPGEQNNTEMLQAA